jgi:lysophospholipase L1-like esterase
MVTPRLPEPEGERSGVVGSGPIIKLLILGDSAAAGVGASHQSEALSGQLVQRLAKDYQVEWELHASTGHTTKDALETLQTLEATHQYDVVITSLGVNDVTSSITPEDWVQTKQQLLNVLQQKFEAKQILLTSVPPMHLFPALPQPLRWCLGLRAADLNQVLRGLVADRKDCYLVEPEFKLDRTLMASDGFHPGPELYCHWAKILADRINTLRES